MGIGIFSRTTFFLMLLFVSFSSIQVSAIEPTHPTEVGLNEDSMPLSPTAIEAPANTVPVETPDSWWVPLLAWLKSNWGEALALFFVLGEFIVRLTPTDRDNAWFLWLRTLIDKLIPNLRAGGGKHVA